MKKIFDRLQKKKAQLDKQRPIPSLLLEKLKHQIFLEWTYNSNAIEGNTLTLQETKLILEEGITVKGKSLREHFEAKNHEKAIFYLETLAKTPKFFTEEQILRIHQLVLSGIEEDFAGRYRSGQVRIMGANFIPPEGYKVPELMADFVNHCQALRSQKNHLELATIIHHRLVYIHPFFDGNGRTARLLMNLFFMQQGYPPAVILHHERKKYYRALNQANNENYTSLELLIAQALERSLDLYLSALSPATDDETYTPLSQLAIHTPYSAEYLSLLARRGLIDAYKNGRNWVSTPKAIADYLATQRS